MRNAPAGLGSAGSALLPLLSHAHGGGRRESGELREEGEHPVPDAPRLQVWRLLGLLRVWPGHYGFLLLLDKGQ